MSLQKRGKDLRGLVRELIDEKMAARQRGLLDRRAALAPLRGNVEQFRHLAGGPIEDQGWTGHLAVDIGAVMVEVDSRGGAIVRARAMDHRRIAPAAAIVGERLRVEIGEPGRAPTDETGLVKEIRI